MNPYFQSIILECTGASSIFRKELVQNLWSGYGKIIRVHLKNATIDSVVVKHVQLPIGENHPRGWNTDIGHQRKIKSYKVETEWYKSYSNMSSARLPYCMALEAYNDEVLIVLEDLNIAGYPLRKGSLDWKEIDSCIQWLAKFHASYLNTTPDGLWNVGTYWHLF